VLSKAVRGSTTTAAVGDVFAANFANANEQGILTEGKGSVQLASSLRELVLLKGKQYL